MIHISQYVKHAYSPLAGNKWQINHQRTRLWHRSDKSCLQRHGEQRRGLLGSGNLSTSPCQSLGLVCHLSSRTWQATLSASGNSGEWSGVSTTAPPNFENAYLARSQVELEEKKPCANELPPLFWAPAISAEKWCWEAVPQKAEGCLSWQTHIYLTSVLHCTPSSRLTAGFPEWVEYGQIRANGPNPASHFYLCDSWNEEWLSYFKWLHKV